MLRANNLTKKFEKNIALNNFNFEIGRGELVALVGSNGAGKSTLLRIISGIFNASEGSITLDDKKIYDNPEAKGKIFYVSDNPFFYNGCNINFMSEFYASLYKNFDKNVVVKLAQAFNLPLNKPITTFSKGMQRQVALILGIATNPDYLLLDEAFDGLDPIMRHVIRQLIIECIVDRNMTVIISTHNLREIEDFCDYAILIHKSELIASTKIDELRKDIHRVQFVCREDKDFSEEDIPFNIRKKESVGALKNYIIQGSKEEISNYFEKLNPYVLEIIDLSFEEIFIEEMSKYNYDISHILGDK